MSKKIVIKIKAVSRSFTKELAVINDTLGSNANHCQVDSFLSKNLDKKEEKGKKTH